ncbi:hypothetical protein I4U23_015853 [Adineta vaga]|nr:hypothetical protein I4U23_015853 [Adineta vaga]
MYSFQFICFTTVVTFLIITCLLRSVDAQRNFVCPEKDILGGCKDAMECIYENPDDCDGFIQCDDSGQVYYQKCNNGLKWNDRIKNCDIARRTTCGRHQTIIDIEKDSNNHVENSIDKHTEDNHDDNTDE